MTKDSKEKVQYTISAALIVAGIAMGFLSFFFNHYDIESGTLVYIAQCFIAGGSFMGVAVYLDKHIKDFTNALLDIEDGKEKKKDGEAER